MKMCPTDARGSLTHQAQLAAQSEARLLAARCEPEKGDARYNLTLLIGGIFQSGLKPPLCTQIQEIWVRVSALPLTPRRPWVSSHCASLNLCFLTCTVGVRVKIFYTFLSTYYELSTAPTHLILWPGVSSLWSSDQSSLFPSPPPVVYTLQAKSHSYFLMVWWENNAL